MPDTPAERLIDGLEATWTSLAALADELSPEEWALPTGCPGWTVHDNVAHVAGLEHAILTGVEPDHELPADLPHVRDDMGRYMEVHVDARRGRPPADVVSELREVAAARLGDLRAVPADGFDEEARGPGGLPMRLADLLGIRLFDCWLHEQDVRRAVGRPGHLEGPAAEISRDRALGALPYVVGKRAGAPDGATVVVEIVGPSAATAVIEVAGGRAKPVSSTPADPTVTIRTDLEALAALIGGRADAAELVSAGRVQVSGDTDLGDRIVASMGVTP